MSSLGIFDKETKTYKKVADLSKPAVIDTAMSDTSTNAVQNKVIKSYVDKGVNSSKKLQTYKDYSTTETYGDDYNIYAQWLDSTHVKMKCDNYTVETDYATSADSASSAHCVTDYNNDNAKIKIGYSGPGISGDSIKYIAGYTAGDGNAVARIKNISKDALKSWLGDATTSDHGLMTPAMVSKLNGIAEGANRTTVDSSMSDTSTNPVQNKVVKKYVEGIQTGYYVGSNPPKNTSILWIDSLHGGMIKYFASDTSKWHPVRAKGYDTPVDLINEGYWHYFLGPGITVENISAIYDINTDKVTIIINNLNIASDASTGPTDMVSIAMPMYNLGHNGSFNPVIYNGPSNIDPYLYLEYPDGVIKTGPPYGIYKPATISSIKFETRLNYPAYTY